MAAPGSDIDVALEELEARLERLRALYEQYFIGIEKLEPSVPRQDVDRRIHALRKTQIRNTAKRFKLQNIIQRYNAFQQYWLRTCREIENGTYHRHVIRAQNRFGDVPLTAAARRRARLGNRSTEEKAEAAEQIERAQRSSEDDLQALLSEDPEAALKQALAAAEEVVIAEGRPRVLAGEASSPPGPGRAGAPVLGESASLVGESSGLAAVSTAADEQPTTDGLAAGQRASPAEGTDTTSRDAPGRLGAPPRPSARGRQAAGGATSVHHRESPGGPADASLPPAAATSSDTRENAPVGDAANTPARVPGAPPPRRPRIADGGKKPAPGEATGTFPVARPSNPEHAAVTGGAAPARAAPEPTRPDEGQSQAAAPQRAQPAATPARALSQSPPARPPTGAPARRPTAPPPRRPAPSPAAAASTSSATAAAATPAMASKAAAAAVPPAGASPGGATPVSPDVGMAPKRAPSAAPRRRSHPPATAKTGADTPLAAPAQKPGEPGGWAALRDPVGPQPSGNRPAAPSAARKASGYFAATANNPEVSPAAGDATSTKAPAVGATTAVASATAPTPSAGAVGGGASAAARDAAVVGAAGRARPTASAKTTAATVARDAAVGGGASRDARPGASASAGVRAGAEALAPAARDVAGAGAAGGTRPGVTSATAPTGGADLGAAAAGSPATRDAAFGAGASGGARPAAIAPKPAGAAPTLADARARKMTPSAGVAQATGTSASGAKWPVPSASAVAAGSPPKPGAVRLESATASTPSSLGAAAPSAAATSNPTGASGLHEGATAQPSPALGAVAPSAGAPTPGPASRRLRNEVNPPEAVATSEASDAGAKAAAARAAAGRAAELRAQSQQSGASRLDAQRLNELHGALVAERRRLNQPGKVSLEALGASLRETETKLKKQYADKNIDFRVVIKDGKAVVKPIIG